MLSNAPDTLRIRQDEWELEQRTNGKEKLTIEGSDAEGNSIFIDIASNGELDFASFRLCFNGSTYVLPSYPLPTYSPKSRREPNIFSIGGLRVELREPFRRWRISFRGLLRPIDISTEENGQSRKLVYVQLRGWWKPVSDAINFFGDLSARKCAKSFTSTHPLRLQEVPCHTSLFKKLLSSPDTTQWGLLTCNVTLDDSAPEEVRLRGLRKRNIDGCRLLESADRIDELIVSFQEGTRIHWLHADLNGHSLSIDHGHVSFPNYEVDTIKSLSIDDVLSTEDAYIPIATVTDKPVLIKKLGHEQKFSYTAHNGYAVEVVSRPVEYCNYSGTLLRITSIKPLTEPNTKYQLSSPFLDYHASPLEKRLFVVPLSHRACQDSNLTGGKGSNLAKLVQLQLDFTVPGGLCITTEAYLDHLLQNKRIPVLLKSLNNSGSLKSEECSSLCEEIAALVTETRIAEQLRADVEVELKRQYGDSFNDTLFAVRSSAVGEDGSELSSAGQLETFLNLSGIDQICENIKNCWASNFRKEVVNYRRQHGQSLTAHVGVVVQQMVTGGVSGVLFTADPVSGNPTKVVINAFAGLGEEVVSGAVTPDTIVLRRVNGIEIEERQTINESMCLNDGDAIKLAKIGTHLEEVFGAPQDVEYAVIKNRVYLLQSRDITNLDLESDWEFMHEFDSGLLTEREILSTLNVGEVLPNALAPLNLSTTTLTLDRMVTQMTHFQLRIKDSYRHFSVMFPVYRNRLFVSVTEMFLRTWEIAEKDPLPEVVVAGTRIITPEMVDIARHRFAPMTIYAHIRRSFMLLKLIIYQSKKHLKMAEKRPARITVPEYPMDKIDLLDRLESTLAEFGKLGRDHALVSMNSSVTYMFVAMLTRGGAAGEVNADILSDIATIFASCQDVISADVPAAIQKLAQSIWTNHHVAEFCKMTPLEAIHWLRSDEAGECGVQYKDFLLKHGHRGIDELDISGIPWGDQPEQLIPMIQTLLSNEKILFNKKEQVSVEDALSRLKHPVAGIRRRLLQMMVNVARNGVTQRETCKSYLVHGTNFYRKGFLRLGTMLRNEGYLPDERLIFYLTIPEIRQLILTRSARLVARATRRRKLQAVQNQAAYPLVQIAVPQPIGDSTISRTLEETLMEVKGTPVCQGVVKARARVARTLAEAGDTQPGEILITRYTDIGWSPYFPIISGLVTEVGGLLSHGAVVAREYGLPSLIAVPNATQLFQTGDLLILDTKIGIVRKVQDTTD
uniref:Phosphoenolpyruvate synthase n=1 Tax=Plectus sambesii TaxID=2011161 RepID=A0A914WYM1_9BILA